MDMQRILLTCRAGFESDLAAEVQQRSLEHGVHGFVRARPDTGFVEFQGHDSDAGNQLLTRMPFSDWVFARQWLGVMAHWPQLDTRDRVTPVARLAGAEPRGFRELWLSFPDTNEGKSLSRLTRKLSRPLRQALAPQLQRPTSPWRLHLFFTSGSELWLGVTPVANGAPWVLGYPRLRMPTSAPSRSTLKLEEAWLQLIPDAGRPEWLQPFQRAVDLGAAPGGWTWQLVQRGLQVIAVDNGPMDPALMASGQVEHRREDAFTFRPRRPVDWLVCDMVEKPARVADLMARWLSRGWCRYAIFNLKLPMKRRWQALQEILPHVRQALDSAGLNHRLAVKQLYHDREEVTVLAAPDWRC